MMNRAGRRSAAAGVLCWIVAVGLGCQAGPQQPPPTPPPVSGRGAPALPRSLQGVPDSLFSRLSLCLKMAAEIQAGRKLGDYYPFMIELARRLTSEPEDVIADIGAGLGFFEFAMLEYDVPFARLFAVEVDARALNIMSFALEVAASPGRERVIPVSSTFTDVTLPPASVDLAVIINTPFFLDRVVAGDVRQPDYSAMRCLQSLWRALKPDGRTHVFQTPFVGNRSLTEEEIIAPFVRAGFVVLSRETFTDRAQHVPRLHLVFGKSSPPAQ